MLKSFERGDRVELRESAIRSGIETRGMLGRQGVVISTSRAGTVRLIWDGAVSPTPYAREFLRRARGGRI